jgi:peptide/nickel transport system substrate-binding protein
MTYRRMMWGLLAACAGVALALPAEAAKRNNTIVFAADQVPESIDSYFNNVRIGVILAHHVWDHLIYRDPKTNEYKGELATGWKWVDDKTLEFDLRQGIKFHNGEPFDADDVVYTLNFVSKPENKAVTQTNVNWIASAEKISQYKVRINLKRTFPAALEYLAGPVNIYPNEYYEKVGPKGMSDKPVGTGPYKVTEHQPGRVIRLERNKDYFKESPRPQPTIEKLELRLIPDRNTQMAELMAGGVDFIFNVPPDQANQLKTVPTLEVKAGETMRIVFLHFNSTDKTPIPALKDRRVRQAFAHAIDREAMLKTVVGEGARVLHTNCFPSQFGCTDQGAPRYAYDPNKAKALLAEAGFPNGIDVDLYAYRERHQTEAMIGYLRAVGIRANLRFMQYAAMRDAIREAKGAIAHQTWGSFSVNDVSASVSHYFGFLEDDISRDPQVRDWIATGDSSVDPAVRKEAYAKALVKIAQESYSVPMYSLPVYYAYTKDLQFTAYPDELPRFWEVTWK